MLHKIYQTVIIGGGASGLMCAVELLGGNDAFSGSDVLVLERNDRVGKKLIATGNGQGNLMNENFSAEFYHGESSFISSFIKLAKKIDLESYLFSLGIPLCTLKDGKKYPLSRQASAVLDVLRANLSYKGCIIKTDTFVFDISKKGKLYYVKTDSEEYVAKSVVLATGGMSAKQFGTDGKSYALAEKLGHKKTELYPSLVQLKTETDKIRGLKGLKEIALVRAFVDGKEKKSCLGDLLFTEYGVSGNTIFQVSSCFNGKGKESLKIEFLPDLSIEQVKQILVEKKKKNYIKDTEILDGILVKRIAQSVLKTAKSNKVEDIAYAIKNFSLKVTGNLGFNYSQVTKGGIKTDDINPLTMESKLKENFYIVGEALDIDGDCGGYNVTFAFISGILAGLNIKTNRI